MAEVRSAAAFRAEAAAVLDQVAASRTFRIEELSDDAVFWIREFREMALARAADLKLAAAILEAGNG